MEYLITRLTGRPELKAQAAAWFHTKWGVPEQAYLLGQFGRLTVLSCGASGDGAICFDCEHYAEQLAELEI